MDNMVSLDPFSGPRWTVGLFVLLASLWGTSFVAIEVGLHHFPPLYFAGARYLLAGLAIMAVAVLTDPSWLPRERADWVSIGIVAVFIIAANHAFLYLGELYVPGAVAAVVVSLSPVLTILMASVMLGRGLPRVHEAAGFLLGIAGVLVIANPDPSALDVSHLTGIGLVFLSAASFAVGGVLSRPFRSSLPIVPLQAWSMVLGSLLLLVVGWARGERVAGIEYSTTGAISLGYLVVFSGVIAFLVYFTLLDRIGPSQLNLVGYLEPIVASIMGYLVLGHVIAVGTAAGFLLIALGFTLIQRDVLIRVLDHSMPSVAGFLHDVGDAIELLFRSNSVGYRLHGPFGKR